MNDREVLELLRKIDDGYEINEKERILLSNIEKIVWKNIKEIPESIMYLTGLKELDVSGYLYNRSELDYLPETIKTLRNLSMLNLSNSKISKVPSSITSLTGLLVLDLSNTMISGLPIIIGKLTNIRRLNLCNNQISVLVPEIGKLKNIQSLNLSNTRISEIPLYIGNLKNLEELDLSITKINKLPASIGRLTKLQSLNLSNTKINGFPAGVEMLPNLHNLDLSYTRINGLTSRIGKMTRLERLYLNNTNINGLTYRIEKLTSLRSLDLSHSKINNLPDSIGRLASLQNLELSNTKISGLPQSIGKLTNLQRLGLAYTNISGLPANIGKLTNLQSLNLSNTKINELPASIGKLTSLQEINLSNTKIRTLPESIGELTNLKRLILEECFLDELPESLLALKLEFRGVKYKFRAHQSGIYIWNLYLKNQPIEIFSQSYDLIVEYYKSIKVSKPINECKVVFLGDGGVGKSLIIHRLINDGIISGDFNGESTPGICISSKKYTIENEDVELHFWDFGGQAIMHSMHRLFLTNRTLYVVVVNARDNKANEQAWYWIRNIKSFANGAPVCLLVNQKDQNPSANVNENGLRKEYPELKQVRVVSALKDTKEEFGTDIRDVICQTVFSMETVHTPFSVSWLSLMNDLQEMPEDYITSDEFYNKCATNLVETDKRLLDKIINWYQDLGVCFYSKAHPVSARYMVLKPRWLLNALYILVFNGRDYAVNGIIKESDIYELICRKVSDENIKKVYSDIIYEAEQIQYILTVLLNYELIFRLDEECFFIPMLCDENEPGSLDVFDSEDTLQISFKYTYLPENVLHKIMVRHGYDLNTKVVWKTGAMFTNVRCGWTALVRMKDNCLDVYARASNSDTHPVNVYLDMMRESICKINESFGITAEESIIFRKGGLKDFFDPEILKGYIENGQHFVYSKVFRTMINIEEIFGVVNAQDRLFGQGNDSKINTLLDVLAGALLKLQDNRHYYSADENTCNTYIRDLLEQCGYICRDQSLHGVSGTGRSAGSPDILIRDKDNGKDLTIYEAQKLSSFGKADQDYLDNHIKRLLNNYNARGFRNLLLISYVAWYKEEFNEMADRYSEYVMDGESAPFKVVDSRLINFFSDTFMRCVRVGYDCSGTTMYVYHMIVRVAA